MNRTVRASVAASLGWLTGCSCDTTPPPGPAAGQPALEAPTGPKVENPLYLRWARFKPGTVVAYREVTDNPGQPKSEQTTRYTVKSVTDERATVTVVIGFVEADGKVTASPSQDQTFDHYFVLRPGSSLEDYDRPRGAGSGTDETVELLGRTFKCKRYKNSGQVEAGPTETVTWLSDDVPGGRLKSVRTLLSTKQVFTSVVTELTSVPATTVTP